MLPFGSITSIVPLFVLAFAYLLYFSANILNKNNADEEKVTKELIRYTPGSHEISLPDFRSFDDPGYGGISPNSDLYQFSDLVISAIKLPAGDKTLLSHKSSSFSPRPPPVQI